MDILRKFKIQHRLWALVLIVLTGSAATIGVALDQLDTTLMQEKSQQTRKLVEVAYHILESYRAREEKGELSRDQAQKAALDQLRVLRYDGDSYFWVNDMQPSMVMHPIKPALDGKPLGDVKDPAGTHLFKKMVDVVNRDGEGAVYYQWPKPGFDQPVPKVSYVKGFPAWGWILGSGIYIDDIQAAFWRSASKFAAIGLGVAVIVVAVVLLIGRSITRPLCGVASAMREIASGDGDLTRQLPSEGNDEVTGLATHFNAFVTKIRNTVAAVSQSTTQLATAAEELSAITGENSRMAASQRVETDQVATAVTEMNATAQEVARNAEDAAESTRMADREVVRGREVMKQTVGSMEHLSGEIDTAGDVIDGLKVSTENIGSVLDVIRGVAEQTNLLALNAAIEAARAGDQGRGFAVVAGEVRTLASRTHESTQEIQRMIERLQREAGKAVEVMNNGRSQTRLTLEQAAEADQALAHIAQSVSTITNMNTQIAAAAEEQTAVSQELDRNVTRIADLAVQGESGNGQTAIASRELAQLGEGLRTLVSQFRI